MLERVLLELGSLGQVLLELVLLGWVSLGQVLPERVLLEQVLLGLVLLARGQGVRGIRLSWGLGRGLPGSASSAAVLLWRSGSCCRGGGWWFRRCFELPSLLCLLPTLRQVSKQVSVYLYQK